MASVVDARPAVAAFAFVSRMVIESEVSPNAETTWYSPSVKSLVVLPTTGAKSRIEFFSSSTRSVLFGIRVAMFAIPLPNLADITTAAAPTASIGRVSPFVSAPPTFVKLLDIDAIAGAIPAVSFFENPDMAGTTETYPTPSSEAMESVPSIVVVVADALLLLQRHTDTRRCPGWWLYQKRFRYLRPLATVRRLKRVAEQRKLVVCRSEERLRR